MMVLWSGVVHILLSQLVAQQLYIALRRMTYMASRAVSYGIVKCNIL
jgi:hypothetical protein